MKRDSLPDEAISRARSLRRTATPAEKKLWRALKEAFPHIRFRRQVPLGSYIVDFCSHSTRLIVEVDGGQHAGAISYDTVRTRFLESEGYRVVRFWNNDVRANGAGVIETITPLLVETVT